MQATDVEPNRLEAASEAATTLRRGPARRVQRRRRHLLRQHHRPARPRPTDRETAIAALADLDLGGRTAIGEGVFTSLDADQRRQAAAAGETKVPAHVVLLSDGTNTAGRTPEEAAAAARKAGVPVSTIAYGTPDGVIEIAGAGGRCPVDEESLAELAEATDGRAYTAAEQRRAQRGLRRHPVLDRLADRAARGHAVRQRARPPLRPDRRPPCRCAGSPACPDHCPT